MKKLFTTCFFVFAMLIISMYSYAETFSVSGAESVSISGKITQFSSAGMSLNDIVIDVKGTKNVQVKTGRSGSYIVSGLPKGGTYTITASKPGYTFQPANKVFRNLDESKVSQDFVAELATYSISGKVIVGGRPVRGVLITINNRPIKYYTDQDGEYVIDNLEHNGGPYEVSVVSDKHFFEPFKIDYLEKDVIHDFRKDISISGRVTSLGQGIGGIEIDVNGTKYKTDDDGYYKINSVLSNGDYVVKVVEEKYNPVPSSVPLKKITSDKFDVNFAVSGQLIGKVTYNGQPFKNVIVTVSDRDQEYKTNAQGMFNVPNLGLNQYYQISLSSAGYKFTPKERVINCLMRESSYQNFKAEIEKYSITVSVNQGKQPLENAEITVSNNATIYKTDKNGVCTIKDLSYGKKYTVTVKKQGVTFVESKKVIDKLQSDERVSFEAKLSISGKVLNKTKPLKDAIVTCGDKKVTTNGNGEYILKDLAPSQNYTVKVSSKNFVFDREEMEFVNLYDNLENINFMVSVDKKEEEALAKKAEAAKLKAEQDAKAKAEAEAEAEKRAEEAKTKAEAEAKAKIEAEKQAKIEAAEAAKAEQARIKAEKEEAERKAKEEKIRLKLEAEEAARKAKEEKEREIAEAKAKAEAEKQAKIEAAKAEQARIKAEKEEAERKAKEEKIRLKLEAEEAARKAKEEKEAKIKEAEEAKAKAEAEKKAKEEQARLDAEIKRLEMEEKAKAAAEAKAKAEAEKQAKIEAAKAEQARIKAEKEEAERKAKEEKERKIAEAKAKAEAAKAEQARIKAEKEEAERKAKEEKIRLKLEAEEAARKAKEEKEAKIKEAEEAKAKAEAEKKAKEEQARLDAEIKRLEMEEKARAAEEAKAKAEAEKQAKIEAAKAEQARIKAEKEEAERKAKEEKIRLKLEAEEAARKAKEEKEAKIKEAEEAKAKAEAEKKAKEEQARLDAEIKRLEMEEKARAAEEAKAKAEAEKQAKIEAAKAEQARIKAEKEEAERKAKEEKERKIAEAKAKAEAEKQAKLEEQARIKAEKEEAERKAKEEKERKIAEAKAKAEAEKQAKLEEQARIKAEKEEAERKAKEEKIRLKLEAEEAARKAKEEKEREIAEAKAAKAEAERQASIRAAEAEIRAKEEKKELLKRSKEEAFGKNKLNESVAVRGSSLGLSNEIKSEDNEYSDDTIYIDGRVLKGKYGVKGVQVRLILEDEEKIFLTDKNGYYRIPELEKGKNYLITVLSGKETLNLSPKSRTYKNLSNNMRKQNFYVVEKFDAKKDKGEKAESNKTKYNSKKYDDQDWNSRYGFENKDGVIQKDIHW